MGGPWADPHTSLRILQSLAVTAWLHLDLCNVVEGREISLEMQISLFWDGLCQVGEEGLWLVGLPMDLGWITWIFELRCLLGLGSTPPNGVEAAGALQFPQGITPSSAS